jgi:16S rRNA (guanine527-N7)-methyltransferase
MEAGPDGALWHILRRAEDIGLVGPGSLPGHLEHARAFAPLVREAPSGPALDLGSGAGVPGLLLAYWYPSARPWTLLDSRTRSATFLTSAIHALGLEEICTVILGRAEELARNRTLAGQFSIITARGFGPPATTAECATSFLATNGRLIVSEPPASDGTRWSVSGLAALGLSFSRLVSGPPTFVCLEKTGPTPLLYPRRVGLPRKAPLF